MKHKILTAFPAFKHKNYRIFFAAQIISLVGTWMQTVAQGYLVYQLTNSAFLVGLVTALGYLPSTFFALIGGTIIDRFHKKRVLQTTQAFSFILATILGILVITNHTSLISLTILVVLLGVVNSIDQPARQTAVIDLVDRENLHSATALNMSIYNSARIVGPALAGWLIFAVGTGWAFLLNGLSFLAPLIAYQFISFAPFVEKPHPGTWNAIKEGVSYAVKHPQIKYLLIYLGIISIFGWSYVTILPVIAVRTFHLDAAGLGLLFSAAGVGSVIGALFMSAASKNFDSKKLILFGGVAFSLSLIAFALTSNFYFALLTLFISGFGMTAQSAMAQTKIQHLVDDHVRGRVMSIQSFMLLGLQPLGSFQVGFVAEHFGSSIALIIGGVSILISAILLFLKKSKN